MIKGEKDEKIFWISKALNAQTYDDFKVELTGTSSATEGYTSDIIFAKVALAKNDKKPQEIHLAVKFCKNSIKEIPLMQESYKKESYFYDTLLKIFKDLQQEANMEEEFDAVPKCYATLSEDQVMLIILENISKLGYRLHRRDLTMNIQHIKLVFKSFAKFHALSFALKHKKSELFNKVADHFLIPEDTYSSLTDFFKTSTEKILKNLLEANRKDLAEKIENFVRKGPVEILNDMMFASVDGSVIVHTDCHCNNFMFQYKDQDQDNPSNVAILDWQLAKLHSPAVDLSAFFFTAASKRELAECTALLHYYHKELSTCLTQLGCNSEDLFPFSVLLDHWKKYSSYGLLYALYYMEFNYIDNDSAPSLDDMEPTEDANSIGKLYSTNLNLKNTEMYMKRLIDIIEHYFNIH